jgi:hypothetical protein
MFKWKKWSEAERATYDAWMHARVWRPFTPRFSPGARIGREPMEESLLEFCAR